MDPFEEGARNRARTRMMKSLQYGLVVLFLVAVLASAFVVWRQPCECGKTSSETAFASGRRMNGTQFQVVSPQHIVRAV